MFQNAPHQGIKRDIKQIIIPNNASFHPKDICEVLNNIFSWSFTIFFCMKRRVFVFIDFFYLGRVFTILNIVNKIIYESAKYARTKTNL